MASHTLDSECIDSARLVAMARSDHRFSYAQSALARIAADRRVVEKHVAAGEPVYGLNTGLGGNLAYRLDAAEVVAFQEQVIRGRMIGMGEPLPQDVVRAALLARCISLARGGSGVSVAAAQGLLALVDKGVTPVVPMLGSISAGDLGLCAHMVAPLIGQGEAVYQGARLSGADALAAAGLAPVALQAKDGLGLINASPLTAGYAAVVAHTLAESMLVAAAVAALADEGYAANPSVFDPRIAAARPAGAQAAASALFRTLLSGSSLYQGKPRSIQDAISFRTMAQVFGSSYAALATLMDAVDVEINGNSDSPIVFAADGDMLSSPNFHPSMVALAFDGMAIALAHLASASVQRVIKLMNPLLSALPKYLSPVGGASVGFNALQKTAAALHAEIRLKAAPASLDAIVVSDTVEDHATHAMLCVRKLGEQLQLYRYLLAIEALVAAQAVDLRKSEKLGAGSQVIFDAVRSVVGVLQLDRPPGPDAMAVNGVLCSDKLYRGLRTLAECAKPGLTLRGL
jgi:histidine ammonia-lyase